MKWWYWLILELLIIFGVMAWIYFFPSEIEDDFTKGMIGFVLIFAIEECKDVNRRKTVSENYTIEQNAGENRIEGGVLSLSVAPKKKHYRPFKDCDELCKYWHDEKARMSTFNNSKSLIWVKHKEYGTDNLITAYDNDNESIGGSCVFIQDIWVDMKELFDNFTFCDGSVCGVEE